ncbi:flagellar hook-length control protein FliK [Bacillus sp. JJ722]|uniref:flagellar hook-length control protein FliK n=1 Tax=Bacillus sp. JJ722 TaxID=3122973 RepID=UPI002FFF0DE5
MMLAPSQSKALNVSTASKGEGVSSTSKFGDVLSQTLKPSEGESMDDSGVSSEQMEKITSLLDFLKLDDITDIEHGEELANEIMGSMNELQNHPLLAEILGGNGQEELLASLIGMNELNPNDELMASLNSINDESGQKLDLIQHLGDVVDKLLGEMKNLASMNGSIQNADSVLKFSKIFTLLKNKIDLSNKQLEQLDALKHSLEKVVMKLDQILGTSVKGNFATIFNRQRSLDAQLQLQNVNSFNNLKQDVGIQTLKQAGMTSGIVNSSGNESITTHNPFITMSKVEQYVLTVPTTRTPVNQEEFMKAFENLLSKAKFSNSNGIQKLFIKLNPESLGSLRIELVQKDGMMMAKIIASTKGAKELLDSQLQGLKQSFVNQNIQVEKIEVSQSFTNLSQERNLQKEQNQQQNQHKEQQQVVDEEEVKDDFQNQFKEALIQAEM